MTEGQGKRLMLRHAVCLPELSLQVLLSYPFPDILFLDVKMPRKNGFDVLEWIKTESLKELMVSVISGSWLAEDVARGHALGAHGYFKKTTDKKDQDDTLREIVRLSGERWNGLTS